MPRGDQGHLISFDESGFTGPELLNRAQPYFVYASHDLTSIESAAFLEELRKEFRIADPELKATSIKSRPYWPALAERLCKATNGRAKLVTHNKTVALSGKFFEYFIEPVIAEKNAYFYGVNFHRYIMNVLHEILAKSELDFGPMSLELQQFMRTFDPVKAPSFFGGSGVFPIELARLLDFCRGYASIIERETKSLRPRNSTTGAWTLDLTNTALFSLLFFHWGHRHPKLRLMCDQSAPLALHQEIFNVWVGVDQSTTVTDGQRDFPIRGNLVAPVEFASSMENPGLQVADLMAGLTMEVRMASDRALPSVRRWVGHHLLGTHSVEYEPEFTQKSNRTVRIGRELLKELASRAKRGADPLEGIESVIERLDRQYPKD